MVKHGDMTGLPVDKGWAWIVLIGTTCMWMLLDGVNRSSGLFILQYQERFGSSASKTTLILTLFMIFQCISGVFVMSVGMKYMSVRTSALVGGVIISACYAVSAFSKHIEVLIVLVGAITGVGRSMAVLPTLSIIGVYFDKHRGFANGVTVAGASVGALAFGPLYTILFDHYGYSGTMLLASGILLNMAVVGCLMRPTDYYTRPKDKTSRGSLKQKQTKVGDITTQVLATEDANNEQDYTVPENVHIQTEHMITQSNIVTKSQTIKSSTVEKSKEPIATRDLQIPLLYSNNKLAENRSDFSDHPHVVVRSSISIISGSMPNVNVNKDEQSYHTTVTDNGSKPSGKSANSIRTLFDIGILKNPVFIHYNFFVMLAIAPSIMTPLFLVPFASDMGISNARIGILMFVLGGMDLIGRLYVGILLDKKVVRSTTYMATVFLIMALINNLLRLVNNFETLMAFAVIQGCFSGQLFAVFPVILREHIGPSQFESALGFANLFMGITAGICFQITGLLRDVTGAYYWTYHMLGGLFLVAAIFAFTLPYTHKRCGKESNDATCKGPCQG